MLINIEETQFVFVDYQIKLIPHIFEAQSVVANAHRLAKIAKRLQLPATVTEHNPDGLGGTVDELRDPGQRVLVKQHFSAVEDGLLERLRPSQKSQGGNARSLPKHLQKAVPNLPSRHSIVIAGVEAHVCLLQTAIDLIEHEFDVWVVTDACGSQTERNRDAAFDRLAGAGAELVTTEMVAFELLRTHKHEAFKDILTVLK